MDLNEMMTGISRVKGARVRPDGSSKESKRVTVKVDYSDCSIEDVLGIATSQVIILWRNTQGKKNYYSLDPQTPVLIKASRPGSRPQEDCKVAYHREMATASDEEVNAEIARLRAMQKAKKAVSS